MKNREVLFYLAAAYAVIGMTFIGVVYLSDDATGVSHVAQAQTSDEIEPSVHGTYEPLDRWMAEADDRIESLRHEIESLRIEIAELRRVKEWGDVDGRIAIDPATGEPPPMPPSGDELGDVTGE